MKLISNQDCEIGKYYVTYQKVGNITKVAILLWDSLFTTILFTKSIFINMNTGKILDIKYNKFSNVAHPKEVLTYELNDDEIFYFITLQDFSENV